MIFVNGMITMYICYDFPPICNLSSDASKECHMTKIEKVLYSPLTEAVGLFPRQICCQWYDYYVYLLWFPPYL